MAKKAVEVAEDKQASDIVMLDVGKVCGFADYFVLCSAESERQITTIREEIENALEKEGAKLLREEGVADSGWILLDYGSVVVHIFAPPERMYYQLDRLWAQAPTVVRIQ